ncbi:MAG: FkbM family methyltransferase [Paracoccaceae bacterium]|nr:FkbM family methyltransferase [Paracoccaceae bacterium]
MRKRIREAAEAGDQTAALAAALTEVSRSHRVFVETTFEEGDTVIARQNGRSIAFPQPPHRENHRTIPMGYVESLGGKYQVEGWCEVEPGDVVVDCGAYVGGFARSVVVTAGRVVLIEPAPANFDCCLANMAGFDNAEVVQAGLFNRTGTMALQMSRRDVDHSLLTPDRGATGSSIDVEILRLDDLAKRLKLKRIDFFKLEAEGAEIEAIEGMGSLRPRKIAIDAGPERYGESPMAELITMLEERGYETRPRGHTLNAVLRI